PAWKSINVAEVAISWMTSSLSWRAQSKCWSSMQSRCWSRFMSITRESVYDRVPVQQPRPESEAVDFRHIVAGGLPPLMATQDLAAPTPSLLASGPPDMGNEVVFKAALAAALAKGPNPEVLANARENLARAQRNAVYEDGHPVAVLYEPK